MDNKNMYICLEAKDNEGNSVYLIYWADPLKVVQPKSDVPVPLHFTKEAVITCGVQSMGCGIFGSKLVLACGLVKDEFGYDVKYKGVITYDTTTKLVSHQDIPVMPGGKVRPLLFQLNNKLYAFDTSLDPHRRSFEVYYPNLNHWHPISLSRFTFGYHSGQLAESEGFGFFSWFLFGYCLCLSLPKDTLTFLQHAKRQFFSTCYNAPLPFPGMAITYCQHGFEDVVLISFSKGGLVEGRRLLMRHGRLTTFIQKPELIFDTKTYFQHDDGLFMAGCFADFGNGAFSLTTFDNDYIYVYMFKISRSRSIKDDADLNLKLLKISTHSYKYTDFFSKAGYTSFSFAGCFAPSGWGKESTEAELYASQFPFSQCDNEEDDVACSSKSDEEEDYVVPCTKCVHNSIPDDMDYGKDIVV